MATMTASNLRDVGPKDTSTHGNSSTRVDLANIADVPYYVESKANSVSLVLLRYESNEFSLERYVRAVDNGDEFQYEEVPVEDFYDDGIDEDSVDILILKAMPIHFR